MACLSILPINPSAYMPMCNQEKLTPFQFRFKVLFKVTHGKLLHTGILQTTTGWVKSMVLISWDILTEQGFWQCVRNPFIYL